MTILVATLPSSLLAQTVQPVILYANALGGSGTETPSAVTAGSDGSLYITGLTTSPDFPGAKRLSASHSASIGDIFVTKVDPSGATLTYSAIVGAASGIGQISAIAVDDAGNLYVAGAGAAADFPTTAHAVSPNGGCFLFKLDSTGSKLLYSIGFPCQNGTEIAPAGLTIDSAGNAYLTGYGSGISTTADAYMTTGSGPFAMKVNPQGSSIVYSTYLPEGADYTSAQPQAIAVDAAGSAYITGSASANGFPVTVSALPASSDPTTPDVFVLKLNADGSSLGFATLFGGSGADVGSAIAVDADGFIYVAGASQTTTGQGTVQPFPTTNGALDTDPGFPRGFLSKLTPSGDAFVFSTLLPGSKDAECIQVRDAGVEILSSQELFGIGATELLQISPAGTAEVGSSLTSVVGGTLCGGSGNGVLGLIGADSFEKDGFNEIIPISPNLKPIGTQHIWFSAISADLPDAPRLDVNTGELLFSAWQAPDGSFPEAAQQIQVTSGGSAVPLSVFGSSFVLANPSNTVTPATITVTAPQGGYTDQLILFAPGARNGLVVLPISMIDQPIGFSVAPPLAYPQGITLSAAGPAAAPVSATVLLSSSVITGLFNSGVSAPLDFTVLAQDLPIPSWLTITPTSGLTPAQIKFTANPAGLAPGAYLAAIQVLGPPSPRGWFSRPAV